MSKYTTIIQGPLKDSSPSLDSIEKYKTYGDVVISTYINDIFHEKFPQEKITGTKIVAIDLPEKQPEILERHNHDTFYYALRTMYNGIMQVTTPYVIKTRSDESWSTFDPFIEEFEKNDESVVYGNIFAAPLSLHPFHFGDHVFILKTNYLENALYSLLKSLHKNLLPFPSIAECVLFQCIMQAMGVPNDHENYREIINIVDINKVKKFTASFNHANEIYVNNFVNPHGVYSNSDL